MSIFGFGKQNAENWRRGRIHARLSGPGARGEGMMGMMMTMIGMMPIIGMMAMMLKSLQLEHHLDKSLIMRYPHKCP
jgi:hypothetical protein